jgi:hypothetical protein
LIPACAFCAGCASYAVIAVFIIINAGVKFDSDCRLCYSIHDIAA